MLALASLASAGCFTVLDFSGFDRSEPPEAPFDSGIIGQLEAGNGVFALSVDKAEVILRGGTTDAVTIRVERAQGFTGAIGLALDGVGEPLGASLLDTVLPAEKATTTLTFTAPPVVPRTLDFEVTVRGTSGDLSADSKVKVTLAPPPGVPDETFGDGGIVVLPTSTDTRLYAVGVGPEDAITVSGSLDDAPFLLRLSADGRRHGSFGDGGVVRLPGDGEIRLLSIGDAGEAVYVEVASQQLFVGRYTGAGTPDPKMASAATRRLVFPFSTSGTGAPIGLVDDHDGGLFVVASALASGGTYDRFVLFARQNDGSERSTTQYDFARDNGEADDLLITNGRLIVVNGGSLADGGARTSGLAVRLRLDGTRDETFGGQGMRFYERPDNATVNFKRGSTAPDGKLVIVYALSDSKLAVLRALPDGSLDESFGTAGHVTLESVYCGGKPHCEVGVDGEGRVVVLGKYNAVNGPAALVRLDTSGKVDPTFGAEGFIVTNETFDSYLTLDSRGRAVVVSGLQPQPELRIRRFTP